MRKCKEKGGKDTVTFSLSTPLFSKFVFPINFYTISRREVREKSVFDLWFKIVYIIQYIIFLLIILSKIGQLCAMPSEKLGRASLFPGWKRESRYIIMTVLLFPNRREQAVFRYAQGRILSMYFSRRIRSTIFWHRDYERVEARKLTAIRAGMFAFALRWSK